MSNDYKRKYLKYLKAQVKSAKKEINKIKLNNLKLLNIRNLKIFGSVCNFALPFVLAGSITVGGIYIIGGGLPFIIDDTKNFKRAHIESDIKGQVEYYESYTPVFQSQNIEDYLIVYSPWQLSNDSNSYERTIRTFIIDDNTIREIINAIYNQEGEYIWENIKVRSSEVQTTNIPQSIYEGYLIESNIDEINRADILPVPETKLANTITTSVDFIIPLVFHIYISYKRKFKLLPAIRDINNEYRHKIEDQYHLNKELELLKSNILKLTKGEQK